MADDSMEIGSDLGHDHNTADDYLDLDIDLTAGRPDDEDFVLEDALSNVDSGEHRTLQPLPPVGADHIMLDDEEYKDAVYDEDLLPEGQEYDMDQEEPSHSFVTLNEPYAEYHETEDTFDVEEGAPKDSAKPLSENEDSSALETLGSNVHLQDADSLQYEAAEDLKDSQNEKETEEHTGSVTNRESRSTSPQNISQEQINVEESGSPSASDRLQIASRHGSVNHSVPDEYHDEALNEQDQKQDNNFPSGRILLPATENILVIYQGAEYALFGSSDSDNPDSFFLSDQSIANKQISDFFTGVRDVIHEDLSEEDELCVLVKHLGLEIEETVCSLLDVTISQILELHERLLSNTELESHGPLRIYLTTRPSFAKRFANLVAGAAEGKGLSQLMVLGESSDEYNISGDGTEDFEPFAVPGEDVYTAEDLENYAEAPVTDLVAKDSEVHSSIEEAGDQDEDEPEYKGNPQDNQLGVDDSAQADLIRQARQGGPSGLDKPSKQRYNSSDGLDEDGDLIDYSEDDFEAVADSAPGDPIKNDLILAEYEAINEDLRRRSLSRAAEGRQHAREPTPTISQDQEVYTTETYSKADSERSDEAGNVDVVNEEEDGVNTEDWNHAVTEEATHNFLVDGNTAAVDELGTNDYLDLSVDDFGPDGGKPTDISSFAELEDVADPERDETFENNETENVEPEYEIDYNLDDSSQGLSQVRSLDKPIDIAASNSGISKTEDILDLFGAEPEAVDNANSSATLSVNTGHDDDGLEFFEDDAIVPPAIVEKQIPVGADDKDEIDYDDDDYGQDLAAPDKSEKSVLSAITNGGTGKRSWQDSDDGMDVTDKDAKRARS